jgi:hypothetical protein
MVGEMSTRRSAQLILLLLPVLYLDRQSRLKVRIHGRPRSDRKRSFLLSAVAPSTSTRHPRKARPINWAQRGGLASGGNALLTPRPHFTAPSCTPGNQVVCASDGPPFRQERRPTRLCRTPGASSGLLAEASTLPAGRSCPGWRPGGPGRPRIGRCRCVTTTMTGCAKHLPHRLHRRLPVHARQIEFGVTIACYPRPTTTHRSITDARNPAELCPIGCCRSQGTRRPRRREPEPGW